MEVSIGGDADDTGHWGLARIEYGAVVGDARLAGTLIIDPEALGVVEGEKHLGGDVPWIQLGEVDLQVEDRGGAHDECELYLFVPLLDDKLSKRTTQICDSNGEFPCPWVEALSADFSEARLGL